jgi:two-component system KDP operon response regulator KdpE
LSQHLERPSVLLVDDEPHVLDALRVLIERCGFAVRTAPSGALALESIVAERPDVVVLDLAMPGMDGVEVIRRVRSWTQLPIIVLSARADETEKVHALEAGADDYVVKPFGARELIARVRSALRREQARRTEVPTMETGDLVVDFARRRVMRAGQEVHLTPTEFALLGAFAANPDRVLTQKYLLNAAFGPGYADASESLRTYVKQVRRKIENDPSRPQLIVTEPGVGYRFRTCE